MYKAITTLLLALVCASSASADPDKLSFHLGSYHAGATTDFEEFNPGIFLTWDRGVEYSVGVFRNSYGRASVAGTIAYPFYIGRDWQFSAFTGLAYYPEDGRRISGFAGDLVPLVGLRASYRQVFVQVLPGDGKDVDAIVSFGFSVPFKD